MIIGQRSRLGTLRLPSAGVMATITLPQSPQMVLLMSHMSTEGLQLSLDQHQMKG
jgi:hypothetical protein